MTQELTSFVRRTTMVDTVTASFFLLTADYGSETNFTDPIEDAIFSAEWCAKEFIFKTK
ncbi:hypothetical protein CASFOL_015822 [Castilleja foliolosa]|uniref:Uncharacterized protein n=1 Tax=Castilleja foliolosa TaxID=1961234 RepID=A0ABD3DIJ9_9LAMI